MEVRKQVKEINDKILQLRNKKHDLIKRYIADNGLKDVLQNIRDSNISCKIISFYFNDEDDVYIIQLDLMEKDFKARLSKKHRMIDEAFRDIDDEFIVRNIMIMGAI